MADDDWSQAGDDALATRLLQRMPDSVRNSVLESLTDAESETVDDAVTRHFGRGR